jgi:hypothetical protein
MDSIQLHMVVTFTKLHMVVTCKRVTSEGTESAGARWNSTPTV